ncbi:hypothetical protein [Streptomyces monashensis]|nr:hypothetical protein [Streptomyces monashensis]
MADGPHFVPTLLADKIGGLTIVQAVLGAPVHRSNGGEGSTSRCRWPM